MYKYCFNMIKSYFRAVHQIITTGHWITAQVGRELKEFGFTEPQYNVLRVLKEAKGEPVTVQQILEKMVQQSSNVTRIVDKLLVAGCVERKECPTNRRKMDITITETGLDILAKLDRKVEAFHQPMMDRLNEEELALLQQLIVKLKTGRNE